MKVSVQGPETGDLRPATKIMTKYVPKDIEQKWQAVWKSAGLYRVDLAEGNEGSKGKYYLLVELPYPSGDLHMGHWFTFAVTDILGRMKRMQGYNVFFPVGFDAFGLPAENAAIKRGINPREWTYSNIEAMKTQFATMGGMHDFEHSVITCDPEYYRWNQWIFLKMFEKGLAYRGKTLSNWCPSCQTVLASENVEAGRCWRCGTEVIQKEVDQWFLKITKYAERLIWQEKPNFVLLHGFTGSPKDNFFPWITKVLESSGYKVQVPELPNTNDADPNEQIEYVLKHCTFDENTILLGHSLGSVIALKVTESKKIRALILAAGFAQPGFKDEDRPFENKFDWKFDFGKIKENIGDVVLLRAENDTAVPGERSDFIKGKIGGEIIDFKAADDHITGKQEPKVLEMLLLFDKTDELDWPQNVREGQNNWIGKSEGAIVEFPVARDQRPESIGVFTTRPDTLCGATFVVLAPEHPKVKELTVKDQQKAVDAYVARSKKKSELERKENKEKTGVFTGGYVKNPLTNKEVPVWVADYVLWGYGTGAIMAVPAHDERDFEFAHKYGLEVVRVIGSKKGDVSEVKNAGDVLVKGFIVNSGQFDGLESPQPSCEQFIEYLGKEGLGKREINYHLHDWSISRQRYWGTPIPVIYCANCAKDNRDQRPETSIDGVKHAVIPVPEKDLPVKLPEIKDYAPKGKPPLATAEEWVNVKCPNCGGEAKREVDTMDTFVDSSWYFLRYIDPKNQKQIFDKSLVAKWLPVELYIGGAEHTLGHTLYSRFFVKFLHDIGQVPFEEYAQKRVHHGVILGPDGARMSKSKGNVVNPDQQVAEFGADAVRMYLAFMGPYDLVAPWNPNGLRGVYHFLQRVWELGEQVTSDQRPETRLSAEDLYWMHKTIKKVGEDIANIKYNTAVASMMEWLNYLSRKAHESQSQSGKSKSGVCTEEYKTMLLLLAPFAPHMTEELWQQLKGTKGANVSKGTKVQAKTSEISKTFDTFETSQSIHTQSWPEYELKYIAQENITIVVQVNGKVRDQLLVEADLGQEEIEKLALARQKVQNYLGKKTPQKIIYVPNKLINLVIF